MGPPAVSRHPTTPDLARGLSAGCGGRRRAADVTLVRHLAPVLGCSLDVVPAAEGGPRRRRRWRIRRRHSWLKVVQTFCEGIAPWPNLAYFGP